MWQNGSARALKLEYGEVLVSAISLECPTKPRWWPHTLLLMLPLRVESRLAQVTRIPVVEAVVRLEMEVLPPLLVVLRELVALLSHPLAPMLGRSCVVALDILPLTVQDAAREAPSVGGPLLPLPPERMHCRRFPLGLVLRVQAGQVEAPLRVARHLRVEAHPRGLRQPSKVRGPLAGCGWAGRGAHRGTGAVAPCRRAAPHACLFCGCHMRRAHVHMQVGAWIPLCASGLGAPRDMGVCWLSVAGQAGVLTGGLVLWHHVGVQHLTRACFADATCVEHTCMCRSGRGYHCVRQGWGLPGTWVCAG